MTYCLYRCRLCGDVFPSITNGPVIDALWSQVGNPRQQGHSCSHDGVHGIADAIGVVDAENLDKALALIPIPPPASQSLNT